MNFKMTVAQLLALCVGLPAPEKGPTRRRWKWCARIVQPWMVALQVFRENPEYGRDDFYLWRSSAWASCLGDGTFGRAASLTIICPVAGNRCRERLGLAVADVTVGNEFVEAITSGYELGWRVGRGLLPELMRRGYHAQGVVGA